MATCTPLRRHSYSAPASFLLDSCIAKVGCLSKKVDSVLVKVKRLQSKSVPDLSGERNSVISSVLDQLLASVVCDSTVTMARPRQCHHCHRLLSHPDHIGIGGGVNLCTLDHYELCPGGRQTGKDWTGCPVTDYDTEDDDSLDPGQDRSGQQDLSSNTQVPNSSSAEGGHVNNMAIKGPPVTKLDPSVLKAAFELAASDADRVELDLSDDEDTDDEEERLLNDEIASWQIKVDQEKQQSEDIKKLEKKRLKRERLDQLEMQKAELMNQSKALQKSFSTTPPAQQESRDKSLDQPTNLVIDNRILHEKASDLAAKQQRKNMDKLKKSVGDLTIGGIRALPGMTPAVEQFLT